ncbi:MAG: cobalamin-independent methionine synthase II family protein [Gammaproteobacteria bacterium]|nr:cobalamin-independent methionine synthase II family protein [Gammaproteobacteria bacterium]
MRTSTDSVLTTHVGSLPRPQDVTDIVFAKEREEEIDPAEFDRIIGGAVEKVIKQQKDAGISIPSDGEMSKISYSTYIKDRLTGFAGDSPRRAPADLKQFPTFLEKLAQSGGTPTYRRPVCVGPIEVKNLEPLHTDIKKQKASMAANGIDEGFMNSATPGVIALFQPSEYHATHEAYIEDVAEAMRHEYEAIVESGLILQLDSPDIGLGRHALFPDLSDAEFIKKAEQHVEVLNHALRNVPADRVRLHICWGNYEGPHICDIELSKVLPTVLKAKPRALLFEASNPRHAHEWRVWQETKLPDDYVLIPGVIDTTTNFVEHPELVADRIELYAGLVGRERIIAGTDCGFATFAGFGAVDGAIAWEKLKSLGQGAEIASRRLWS